MALGLIGLGLMVLLQYAGLTWYSARQLDRQALAQSTQRVQDMLDRAQRIQIAVSEEYGWWDELITALDTHDLDWLNLEFDTSIYARYGITEVVALNDALEPVYAANPITSTPSSQTLGWDLELFRPAITATQSSSLEFPESASDVLVKNGVTYVVTAAALTRNEYEAIEAASLARPTLLLMAPIDSAYLQARAQEIQVQDLRWSLDPRPAEGVLAVRNSFGDIQSYLSWTIARPGALILSTAAIWSAPIILLSFFLGALLLRRFQTLIEHSRQADIQSFALKQSQTYFQTMSDNAPVLIWQTDLQGRLTYRNGLFAHFLSELKLEDTALSLGDIPVDGSDGGLHSLIDSVLDGDAAVRKECLFIGHDNQQRWLSVVGVMQQRSESGSESQNILFSATDITDRKKTELIVWNQANFDPLTHLANRSLLLDRLEQELASTKRGGSQGAIMFIDLDKFKTINDSLGHSVGDQVLQTVARRISDCLRDRDTAARFGGDEFVVLLPGATDESGVEEVAHRIKQALAGSVAVGNPDKVFVTASIGIALYPQHGSDSDVLLNRADKAMYRAKSDGRNKVEFYRGD